LPENGMYQINVTISYLRELEIVDTVSYFEVVEEKAGAGEGSSASPKLFWG
jgi:hypothetical protein